MQCLLQSHLSGHLVQSGSHLLQSFGHWLQSGGGHGGHFLHLTMIVTLQSSAVGSGVTTFLTSKPAFLTREFTLLPRGVSVATAEVAVTPMPMAAKMASRTGIPVESMEAVYPKRHLGQNRRLKPWDTAEIKAPFATKFAWAAAIDSMSRGQPSGSIWRYAGWTTATSTSTTSPRGSAPAPTTTEEPRRS